MKVWYVFLLRKDGNWTPINKISNISTDGAARQLWICYFAKLQIWHILLIKMCSNVKTLLQRHLWESQIIFVFYSKFWLLSTFLLIKCVKFAILQNSKFQSCLAAPSVKIFEILLMGVQFPSFLSKKPYQSFKLISEKLLKWFFKKRLQSP